MKKTLFYLPFILLATACSGSIPEPHEEKTPPVSPSDHMVPTSGFIPYDTALNMIASYKASLNSGMNLLSLVFEADDIRSYLADSSITKVSLELAHTPEYIHAGHFGQPAGYRPHQLTLILTGMKSDGTIVFMPNNLVLNKAYPCPPLCNVPPAD